MRVPKRFAEADLENVDLGQFRMVHEYAEMMSRYLRKGVGLLLSGPPGIGKTWAIVALTKAYESTGVGRRDAEFVTAPDFFEKYAPIVDDQTLTGYDNYRGRTWTETFHFVPWLVINDLGKEYRGGKMQDQAIYKLGRILRERNERGLVTHITTNLPLVGRSPEVNTIESVYGQSIKSLLSEMVRGFEVQGQDRRSTELDFDDE